MKLMSIFKKYVGIGLDIGNRWTKLIKLKGTPEKINLERIGRTFLTKEDLLDTKRTSSKIKTLVNSLEIKEKDINTSIAGHSVIIKRLTLPPIEKNQKQKKQFDELIKQHAKEHIPFDIENVYMDYCIVESEGEDSNQQKEYFLVASKKEIIRLL